jgi:hypothetical protein
MDNGVFCAIEIPASHWVDTDWYMTDLDHYKKLLKDGDVRSGVSITHVGTNETEVINRFREAENEGHRWVFLTDRSQISWPTSTFMGYVERYLSFHCGRNDDLESMKDSACTCPLGFTRKNDFCNCPHPSY